MGQALFEDLSDGGIHNHADQLDDISMGEDNGLGMPPHLSMKSPPQNNNDGSFELRTTLAMRSDLLIQPSFPKNGSFERGFGSFPQATHSATGDPHDFTPLHRSQIPKPANNQDEML